MAGKPPKSPDDQNFTSCPYCTIQIPSDADVCPHCQQVLSIRKKYDRGSATGKEPGFVQRRMAGTRQSPLYEMWTRYGKWVKVAGPLMAAAILFLVVYALLGGYKVRVVPTPGLSVKVMHEKKGQAVVLNVYVTNDGEDIPDLSLKSIGVVTEFVYRDGRREKKTVFPKAEFRGEGSLLHGETGSIEIEAPAKGLKEVNLRSEILDLGSDRKLVPPGGWRR